MSVARAKSGDKRGAILAAATRVIVTQGLSAQTAVIAREAGVANGTLFTYFKTKGELLNALYLDLKSGMAAAALKGFLPEGESRRQYEQVWLNWMGWAEAHPEKRRALAVLGVSDEITPKSREAGHKTMAPMREMLERIHKNGAMRGASRGMFLALMNSVAEATMDFMVEDPKSADKHCRVGFEALWRMIG
jgi:AcrR family transcriptional regulator